MIDLTKLKNISSIESHGNPGVTIAILGHAGELDLSKPNELSNMASRMVDDLYQKANDLIAVADPMEAGLAKEEKAKLIAAFGGRPIFVEEIPNEYYSKGRYARPWLMVTTPAGHFKIGWRKRVIQIDWSRTTVKDWARELFASEDTTKDDQMIHAWSYEKAKEYINRIHEAGQ